MEKPKVIAVVGATGSQGGGLARAIVSDKISGFKARALTRDTQSAKARNLADLGAEVVKADMNDLESMIHAFRGAYGAYCVTNFWEHSSPAKEFENARTLAQAAKQAGVRHVIWSTLEDTRKRVPLEDLRMPTLMGKYKVPHFDAKGEANRFFVEAGVPTTFLLTSFYWDNFIYFGMGPKKGADGVLELMMPMADKKLAGIAAEDIGKCALGIFKKGEEFIGKTVGIAGEFLTGAQLADEMSRALGQPVRYGAVPFEAYRKAGFPGAEDLGNMFQYYVEFEKEFCESRDPRFSRALNPELKNFQTWLGANKSRIPVG
jgi:uncharacterized protein YbjT (DUF2867 family)